MKVTIALGLLLTFCYFAFALSRFPPYSGAMDTMDFRHWSKVDHERSTSVVDLSVMNPVQGLAGLSQPLGVFLNPVYLAQEIFPAYPARVAGTVVGAMMLICSTLMLGLACGLETVPAMIIAQAAGILSFQPAWGWCRGVLQINAADLFNLIEGTVVPAAFGVAWLAAWLACGRFGHRLNIACLVLLPFLLTWSVLADPLYTAVFWVPLLAISGMVLFLDRKPVRWRMAGAGLCAVVLLAGQVPQFYRALTGYAARATFPDELYVEIQTWDQSLSMFYQGGLATAFSVLSILASLYLIIKGTARLRALAAGALICQLSLIVASALYLYSGLRWSAPLPVYMETILWPISCVIIALAVVEWVRTRKRK